MLIIPLICSNDIFIVNLTKVLEKHLQLMGIAYCLSLLPSSKALFILDGKKLRKDHAKITLDYAVS
jgi:hypothetical protein